MAREIVLVLEDGKEGGFRKHKIIRNIIIYFTYFAEIWVVNGPVASTISTTSLPSSTVNLPVLLNLSVGTTARHKKMATHPNIFVPFLKHE